MVLPQTKFILIFFIPVANITPYLKNYAIRFTNSRVAAHVCIYPGEVFLTMPSYCQEASTLSHLSVYLQRIVDRYRHDRRWIVCQYASSNRRPTPTRPCTVRRCISCYSSPIARTAFSDPRAWSGWDPPPGSRCGRCWSTPALCLVLVWGPGFVNPKSPSVAWGLLIACSLLDELDPKSWWEKREIDFINVNHFYCYYYHYFTVPHCIELCAFTVSEAQSLFQIKICWWKITSFPKSKLLQRA